jgi:hypothetical protein
MIHDSEKNRVRVFGGDEIVREPERGDTTKNIDENEEKEDDGIVIWKCIAIFRTILFSSNLRFDFLAVLAPVVLLDPRTLDSSSLTFFFFVAYD